MDTEKKKQVRLNSERTLPHDTFKLKMGVTNRTQPTAVYIEGKTCITPNEEKYDYRSDVRNIEYNLKKHVRNATVKNDDLVSGGFILDMKLAESGIKKNKPSYLTFEITLKLPKSSIPSKLNDIKKRTQDDIYEIVDLLEENILERNFSLSKTKR